MSKLVIWLNGKKTALGALSLLLWVLIYALPAFGEFNWVTHEATQLRNFMQAMGVNLDNELFNVGTGATVIGLLDKVRKMFSEEETK